MFENISEIPSKVVEFFLDIVDMITSVIDALQDFYNMLQEFDARIVLMAESCGTSEFTGLPIVDAIGTFRYLVGEVAFMMIYFGILIGCLLTIFKLVVLLYEAIDGLVLQVSGVSCSQYFGNMLTKIFK
ncbi:MAG: hypothetical protein IJ379_10860 [Lachnospiraceae bacterium]|nr:hypothetical protein [Lachnospiraceae bacterium]